MNDRQVLEPGGTVDPYKRRTYLKVWDSTWWRPDRIRKKVGPVAENRPSQGPTGLEDSFDDIEEEVGRNRVRRGKIVTRTPVSYWRRVPSVGVLPRDKRRLPGNFLLRSVLVLAIGLLALLAGARYLDWTDFNDRAEVAETQSQSLNRQLTARQNEIEPLQAQINLLILELESAQTTYGLATVGQADWFTAMSGLFAVSVSGVDFISGTVDSDGKITLVGVATSPDAIASLPTQFSRLAGIIDLQGIRWDAAVSPPRFNAEFRVSR